MSAVPLPIPRADPAPAKLAALVDAFETECRLLVDLTGVLLRQRDGLSTNDLATLDESVYSAQRVFLTIQQARRRRRALLELLVGRKDVELRSIEETLGLDRPHELTHARDRLLEAAQRLERELRVNRRVIDGALTLGDKLTRAISGAAPSPVYTTPGSGDDPGGAQTGAILNTRV